MWDVVDRDRRRPVLIMADFPIRFMAKKEDRGRGSGEEVSKNCVRRRRLLRSGVRL